MGRIKRLVSNTAILGAGTFTSKVLVFLLMPFYTAILSKEEFGIADILTQTANLLIPLVSLGITEGVFRFSVDANKLQRQKTFTHAIITICGGVIPFALLAQLLGLFDTFEGYVWLLVVYVTMANLHAVCAAYIRACGKTHIFALRGICNTLLTIALNVIFLLCFEMGVMGYMLSVVVADGIVTLSLMLFCRLYRDIKPSLLDLSFFKDVLKFSLPYIPTAMMWMITSASDRYIVTYFCGVEANGLYAAAYKLPTIITIAGGVFMEAWHFSSINDISKEERAEFFGKVYRNYFGIMFMGTSLLIALSGPLTKLLLDSSYHSSWIYVPILGMAMIFSAFSSFMASVYYLKKKSVRSLITAAVGAGINLVLNFALIPQYGAVGASIATVCSYVVVYIIRMLDTRRELKFDLCLPRMAVNTALLIVQTVFICFQFTGYIYVQIAVIAIVIAINAREIIRAITTVLRRFFAADKV